MELLLEALVTQCAEGTSVFFSSHQIEEVERVADQVCVIHRGSLVMDTSLDKLKEFWARVEMVVPGSPSKDNLRIAGVERIQTRGGQVSVIASGNVDGLLERARELGAETIQVKPMGLREIFLQKTEEGNR